MKNIINTKYYTLKNTKSTIRSIDDNVKTNTKEQREF